MRRQGSEAGARSGLHAAAGAGLAALASLLALAGGCSRGTTGSTGPDSAYAPSAAEAAFLDTLAERTFRWFWDSSDPRTGLTRARTPTESFASVGAVGFALTAYPIGAERGFVSRARAAERARNTLRYFWRAPQSPSARGATGYKGFFYHFLNPATGLRFEKVELSTMDTALFLAGALFCQSYFDRSTPLEAEIRALADSIYARTDWRWAQVRPPTVSLGWHPEKGHLPYDWRGYNESLVLLVLALGSPRHAVTPDAWHEWVRHCAWGEFYGQEHVGFAPLFGHQYSHVWIDFAGIQDSLMRHHGIDWFENSRRATLAQRAYALDNPSDFAGYGEALWGLTACDGPFNGETMLDGRRRLFQTYAARGASFTQIVDDGTVAPTAVGGSLPFAPELAIPTLYAMRREYGEHLFGRYGFYDALNPTLDEDTPTQHGKVVAGVGWFDGDYLGIDQGPILAMLENYRSGLVWRVMRRNRHVVRGLEAAGFTGGWLEAETAEASR